MLPEALGAAGGAATGGILSDALSALGAPRRALWSMLGLPEQGSALISNLTGMDPNGTMAQVLGFGAEMLGDPLTYAGGLLGRGIGGYLARDAEKMNAIRQEMAAMQDAKAATEAAVAGHAGELAKWEAQSAATQAQHAGKMANFEQEMAHFNQMPPELSHANVGYNPKVSEMMPDLGDMSNFGKRSATPELPFHKGGLSYKRFSPDTASELDALNLGQTMPSGLLQMNTVDKPPFLLGTGGYLRSGGDAPSHLLESLGGGGAVNLDAQSALLRDALQGGKPLDAGLMGAARPTAPALELGARPMEPTLRDVLGSSPNGFGSIGNNPQGILDMAAQQALPMMDDAMGRNAALLERLGLTPTDLAMIGGTGGGVFGAGIQNFNRR